MNMTRVSVCCALLLGWALALPADAQYPDYSPGVATVSGDNWYIPFDPYFTRARFRSDFGGGPGYDTGFQTLDAFLPATLEQGRSIFFLDVRGFATNNSEVGGNIGAGFRWYDPDLNRVQGLSAWYDHDNSAFTDYSQWGVSYENLGTFVDFRLNAYVPMNQDENILGESFTGQNFFFMNNIAIGRTALVEAPLRGGDFEIGGALPGIGDFGIRTYAGGYYYQGDGSETAFGVKTRLEALITEDLSMDVAVTDDKLFGTNVIGSLTITLPDGKPSRILSRQPTYERLYAQLERKYRVTVNRRVDNDPVAALRNGDRGAANGPDGTPIRVFHVDNNAGPGGDGTFENPSNVLPSGGVTPDFDIIFVNRGDGTSNNMDNGFLMRDNQRLLGEGFPHLFSSLQGVFDLPGFTPPQGNFPVITNTGNLNGGNVVVLANNVEVSAFTIGGAPGSGDEPESNGIFGSGISDFSLNNLSILTPDDRGISLVNVSGLGEIFDSNIQDAGDEGIGLDLDATTGLDLIVDNVQILRSDDDNFVANILNGSDANIVITDSTFDDAGDDGLEFAVDGSTLSAIIDNAIISDSFDNGIFYDSTNDSMVVSQITGSQITNSGPNGILFNADSGEALMIIGGPNAGDGNSINGVTENGMFFDITDTALLTLNAQGNTIGAAIPVPGAVIRNGFDTSSIPANDDGSGPLTALGFTANFFGQIFTDTFVNNNGNLTFNAPLPTFTPFPLLNQSTPIIAPFFADVDTRLGNLVTFGQGTADGRLAFGANYLDVRHFSVNGANQGLPTNAFQVVLIDRSDINAGDFDIEFNYSDIQWEAGEASGSDPMGLGGNTARVGFSNGVNTSFELPGSDVDGAFLNGGPMALVSNSLNSGVLGRYVFQARSGNINTTPIAGIGDGIRMRMDGNTVLRPTILDNTVTNANRHGISLEASDNAIVNNLLLRGNTLQQNNAAGLNIEMSDNAALPQTGVIDTNIISMNGTNGIQLTATDNAQVPLLISNNTIMGNLQNGFIATAEDSADIPLTFDTNIISMNGNDAIQVAIDGGARMPFVADGNTFDQNGGDGISLTGTGGTVIQASITNNDFTNNGGFGAVIDDTSSQTLLTVDSNLFDGNTDANLSVRSAGLSSLASVLTITNNDFLNAVDNTATVDPFPLEEGAGVSLFLRGGVPVNPRVFNTTITDNLFQTNAAEGLRVDMADSTLVNGNVSDNIFDSNGTDNLAFIVSNSGRLNLNADSNMITGAGASGMGSGDGMRFQLNADAVVNVNVTNNIIEDSRINGVEISANQASVMFGLFQNNEIRGSVLGDGMNINFTGSSRTDLNTLAGLQVLTFDNNLIEDNGDDGITIVTNDQSVTQFVATNNIVQNNASDGIELASNETSFLGFNEFVHTQDPFDATRRVTNNIISGNGAAGYAGTGDNQSDFSLGIDGDQITDNGDDGLFILMSGIGEADASDLRFTMVNSQVLRNTGRGLDLQFVEDSDSFFDNGDGTSSGIAIQNNIISSNGGEGVFLQTNSGFHSALRNGLNNPGTFVDQDETAVGSGQYPDPPNPGTRVAGPADTTVGPFEFALDVSYNDVSFSLVDNVIQANGNVTGADGVFIRVSTASYIRADVRNNTWNGNFNDDFATESFIGISNIDGTTQNTPASVVIIARNAGATPPVPERRRIFLDNLARLDLRFTGNGFPPRQPGDSLRPNAFGAVYPSDPALPPERDDPAGRDVTFFRVEDTLPGGGSIINNTNVFTQPGSTVPRDNFENGGYFFVPAPSFPIAPETAFPIDPATAFPP